MKFLIALFFCIGAVVARPGTSEEEAPAPEVKSAPTEEGSAEEEVSAADSPFWRSGPHSFVYRFDGNEELPEAEAKTYSAGAIYPFGHGVFPGVQTYSVPSFGAPLFVAKDGEAVKAADIPSFTYTSPFFRAAGEGEEVKLVSPFNFVAPKIEAHGFNPLFTLPEPIAAEKSADGEAAEVEKTEVVQAQFPFTGYPGFYSAGGFPGNYFYGHNFGYSSFGYPHSLGYPYHHPYYYSAGNFLPRIVPASEEDTTE